MTNLSASDIAGLRIREARKKKDWSVRDLADHCTKAGVPHITATVITNLETRRRATREITVDELLAIAHVLDAPPLQLLSPLNAGEQLEIVPGTEKGPLEAASWIADDSSFWLVRMARDGRPEYTDRLLRFSQQASALILVRQIREVTLKIRSTHLNLTDGNWLERHPDSVPSQRRAMAVLGERLFYLLESLTAAGYEPLPLDDVMGILRGYGIPATLAEWRARDYDEGDDDVSL